MQNIQEEFDIYLKDEYELLDVDDEQPKDRGCKCSELIYSIGYFAYAGPTLLVMNILILALGFLGTQDDIDTIDTIETIEKSE